MKTTQLFGLIIAILITSSCSGILDTSPLSSVTPEVYLTASTSNMNNGLTAVYDILGSNEMYGDKMISYYDLNGDEGYYARTITTPSIISFNNYSSNEPQIRVFWRILYKGIERANVLLSAIDKADTTVIKSSDLNRIKGEALFLRAYYYYLLVQNWGDVPLVLCTATQSIDNIKVPRDSTIKVYRQILTDMKTAEGLVASIKQYAHDDKLTGPGGGRVSKSAVRGVLARVCLSMAGYPLNLGTPMYQEAKSWTEKVITVPEGDYKHDLLTSYRQVFINYQLTNGYDTRESIWEVEFFNNGNTLYNEGGYLGLSVSDGEAFNGAASPSPTVCITKTLWDLYEKTDTLRSRWNRFCYKITYTYDASGAIATTKYTPHVADVWQIWQSNCGKYRRDNETRYATYSTSINFPLLRYADVLLMYAEAENEINPNSSAAYDAINKVRRRAYGKLVTGALNVAENDLPNVTKYPQYTADQAGLRKAIQDERSRELCFEGLRKQDLVRWGIFTKRMQEVAAQVAQASTGGNANFIFANVQDKHRLYPIPALEMIVNEKLVQNPGW